jgi:hypothetical protein
MRSVSPRLARLRRAMSIMSWLSGPGHLEILLRPSHRDLGQHAGQVIWRDRRRA